MIRPQLILLYNPSQATSGHSTKIFDQLPSGRTEGNRPESAKNRKMSKHIFQKDPSKFIKSKLSGEENDKIS